MPSNFKRRTSFGASINEMEFLKDVTGARRFLPLSISTCTPLDSIDHQQYTNGAQWWCTPELEQLLITHHKRHTENAAITEVLADMFNVSEPVKHGSYDFRHYSIAQMIIECGINAPTREQMRQAKAFIESCGFKQVQSTNKVRGYWVTRERNNFADNTPPDNFSDNTQPQQTKRAKKLRKPMYFVINEDGFVIESHLNEKDALQRAIELTNTGNNRHCTVKSSTIPHAKLDKFKEVTPV
jgi:predicted P-loop ATPase